MADLLDFCLAIQAEIDRQSGTIASPPHCPGCDSEYCGLNLHAAKSKILNYVCAQCGHHWPVVLQPEPDVSIIQICADWLEERGDPRAEALRSLALRPSPYPDWQSDARLLWCVDDNSKEWVCQATFESAADASRELLRRALGMLTAKLEPCEACGGKGTWHSEKAVYGYGKSFCCSACKGMKRN